MKRTAQEYIAQASELKHSKKESAIDFQQRKAEIYCNAVHELFQEDGKKRQAYDYAVSALGGLLTEANKEYDPRYDALFDEAQLFPVIKVTARAFAALRQPGELNRTPQQTEFKNHLIELASSAATAPLMKAVAAQIKFIKSFSALATGQLLRQTPASYLSEILSVENSPLLGILNEAADEIQKAEIKERPVVSKPSVAPKQLRTIGADSAVSTLEEVRNLVKDKKGQIFLLAEPTHYNPKFCQEMAEEYNTLTAFSDNLPKTLERLEKLNDEAKKQNKKAPAEKKVTAYDLRMTLDKHAEISHTGGGQAGGVTVGVVKLLKKLPVYAIGVPTCDYSTKDEVVKHIKNAFEEMEGHLKQGRNIIFPVKVVDGKILHTMASDRAAGRQSDDFKGQAVVDDIQERLVELYAKYPSKGKVMDAEQQLQPKDSPLVASSPLKSARWSQEHLPQGHHRPEAPSSQTPGGL